MSLVRGWLRKPRFLKSVLWSAPGRFGEGLLAPTVLGLRKKAAAGRQRSEGLAPNGTVYCFRVGNSSTVP